MIQDEKGIYHWIYEMDMKQDRSILRLILKIVLWCMIGILALIMILCLHDGMSLSAFMENAWIILLCLAVIIAICFFAYWLVSKMYGGRYVMLYDMDEEGIAFSQTYDEAEKTRLLAAFSSLAGAAVGNHGLAASGMAAAGNTGGYSRFAKVRRVTVKKNENRIDLYSPFLLNMIYIDPKDFDFVEEFICKRCTKARIV